MTSLAFAFFCFENATFPQLAQLLAVQFCPNHKIDETLKKFGKYKFFVSESLGFGRWEQIVGGGVPALTIQDPEVNQLRFRTPNIQALKEQLPKIQAL